MEGHTWGDYIKELEEERPSVHSTNVFSEDRDGADTLGHEASFLCQQSSESRLVRESLEGKGTLIQTWSHGELLNMCKTN